MVSSRIPQYEAALVRLIHGNPDPRGPGFKELELTASFAGPHLGTAQPPRPGSYVRVEPHEALEQPTTFAVSAWIWPTLPGEKEQSIIARWSDAEQRGFALMLDETGSLSLRLGCRGESPALVSGSGPLSARTWYRVEAVVGTREVELSYEDAGVFQAGRRDSRTTEPVAVVPHTDGLPLLIGAAGDGIQTSRHFNGKI